MATIHRRLRSSRRTSSNLALTGCLVVLILFILNVLDTSTNNLLIVDLPRAFKTAESSDGQPCIQFPPGTALINPKMFMEEGEGKEYLDLYHNQLHMKDAATKQRRQRRLLKVRLVRYISRRPSCEPIYIHLHKNGGSTMNFEKRFQEETVATSDFQAIDTFYTPREQRLGRERFENETFAIMKRSSRFSGTIMPIFTFLRDPVSRFLSSIGQALKLNQLGACSKSTASTKDSRELIQCVLSTILQTHQYIDEHLEPQIFELYHGMMGLNLNVHLMDIGAMNTFVEQSLNYPIEKAMRRKTTALVKGYNLSSSILNTRLVDEICMIYRVDVIFILASGVTSTICRL